MTARLKLEKCPTRAGFYKATLGPHSAIIELRRVSYGAIYGFDESQPAAELEAKLAGMHPRRLAVLAERAS